MMSTAEKTGLTAAELLDQSDSKSIELVNGEPRTKTMSGESSHIAILLAAALLQFVRKNDLGCIFGSDCGFQCFEATTGDPERVRRPDVSFVAKGRLTQEEYERGFITVAPDLAVEVVSPNDRASELSTKLDEYLQAGVKQVWILQPKTKTVDVHLADGTSRRLHASDMLTAESMIPGFQCLVGDLFPEIATP